MKQFHLRATLLIGSLALACETESEPRPSPVTYGEPFSQIRVVAPDGRTFLGQSAQVLVLPRSNLSEDTVTVNVNANAAGNGLTDPTGQLNVKLERPTLRA